MSNKTKSKKNSTTHYYGCVYGGIMKQGFVSFFSTTEDPEEHFVQYKDWYGHKVRGRYVKVSDEEDYLEKLEEKLNEQHVYNKIYEVSVDTASKTLKELTGSKKTSLLGEEDGNKNNADNDDGEKKIKVKTSKSKKSEEDQVEENTVSKKENKKETKKDDKKEDKKQIASKSANNKKSKPVESEEDSDNDNNNDNDNDNDNEPSEVDSDNEEPEVKPLAKVPIKKDKKETKAKSSK